jgi:DNA-binding transcriptional LysR family regulator
MVSKSTIGWDDLHLIKAVSDGHGLQAAAERLGLNHSTVFRRLAQIEAKLGAPVFERHRTGYTLTTIGEEVAALASRIDDEVSALSLKLSGRSIAPAGELRITTNDTLLVNLMMPIISTFRVRYPDIRLDVVLANQALNLSKRDADVALRATDNPPETLVGRRLATIAWAVYGRRDMTLHAKFDDADWCNNQNWVALGDNLSHLKVARYVRDLAPQSRMVYRVNTVLGLAEAVEAGIGIGPVPCFIADKRPELIRLNPPKPEFSTGLWLLTHPDLRHAPRVRAFMDTVAAEMAKYRSLIEGELPQP